MRSTAGLIDELIAPERADGRGRCLRQDPELFLALPQGIFSKLTFRDVQEKPHHDLPVVDHHWSRVDDDRYLSAVLMQGFSLVVDYVALLGLPHDIAVVLLPASGG